jgi:hypothetical protein
LKATYRSTVQITLTVVFVMLTVVKQTLGKINTGYLLAPYTTPPFEKRTDF